ncbi:bifunctional glycosyltransferase/CDP-glycerol:glycerophosphate glycerophosphotransferase [Cytobacillus oceanisediminis]|uniref:bifunctional glycosyltransferase/CDP-glycerol:glycerophosphate glycerophosphotransferase n=1 Tax=Cytobacillus oceanisediminis TaxID=665099 RepID=UPI0020423B52|nr:bifunctional glycosyltransferase family 2 protein/CDP-glycerol:glycerophosphate glycerophosphotransferase [Cytobacillus oceanisediminis]
MVLTKLNTQHKPPKLSVVVIAFNNELYIEECLESLHEQTYKDFEVVVVNDYSKDKTGEIIDDFIKDKPNFKSIHLQENSGGCSTPRNTGIENTTGEYIMFLDGDDWYTVDACEKMVAAIERTGSDFVAGQAIRTNNYHIWYHNQIYNIERTNINIRDFKVLLFDSVSTNKIYKRSFLDKHHLRFPEGIHYEDVVFTGKAYFLAESVSIIPKPIYYWRVVENAAVKSISNRRFEFENFENRIISHRYYDKFLRENRDLLYQEHKNNRFLRHDLKLYINDYLEFDEEYKEKFHALIYEYMHEVMDEYAFTNLAEKDRILYYLLYLGDKEAFQDYIAYINGLPTKANRIYAVADQYYFRPSIQKYNEKFLRISSLRVDFNLHDMKLNHDKLVFQANINSESINDEEIDLYWVLRNNLTKEMLVSDSEGGNRYSIDLKNMEPGNYYLSLVISHQGNLHKRLVKKTDIHDFSNKLVKNNGLSKAFFINHKNSFAIQVLPLRRMDQVKWMFSKRRKPKQHKKPGVLQNALTNFIKGRIKKLPVKSNWVVFEAHMGKQYSDSPKYIYEELLKGNNKYKYIWSFEDPEAVEVPGNPVKVKKNSLKYYYYLNRSKYWVDNQGIAHLVPKKKDQVYLQTWHGTPLKRMGYDQKKLPSETELSRLRVQTDAWDFFISPNSYSSKIFTRGFRYGGEILETGYPRNDILINKPREIAEKVRNETGISEGKKVILFAPTFRDWDPNSFQKTLADIQQLSKSVDQNTIILLRLHYLLSAKISHMRMPENVINASGYQDIQELYLVSDVLISDYSSVMFDFALLKRPIILYCYDLEEYLARRGTYFDLVEKAPGPICRKIDEVNSFLNHPARLNEYEQLLDRFVAEFGSIEDGNASKRVVNRVFH